MARSSFFSRRETWHLGHTQLFRRLGLGLVHKIPQNDELPVPGLQLSQDLPQSHPL